MSLDLRLRAYTPNGASQGILPAPDSAESAHPLNDTPALTATYATQAPRSDLLGQPLELAVEISADLGVTWTEPPDGRFLYLADGRDPVKTADAYAITAKGYVWRLTKAKVLAEGQADENNQRTFTAVTPGAILATFFTEAQNRGALAGMTLQGSAAVDASGAAWGVTLSRSYDLGTDYLTVLTDLATGGYLDFRMEGRTLRIFKADTTLATDRTATATQVAITPLQLTEGPFQRTWEGLADYIAVAGDDGAFVGVENANAVQPWGRWEEYVTQGGVTDTGTLTAYGQKYQSLTADARVSLTQGLALAVGPMPLVDYFVGDYVFSRGIDATQAKYRVRQVTLTKDGAQVSGNVVLNDRFLESDIRVQRALDAITGGAASGGSTGGTTTTTPPGADILQPAPVGTVTATSTAYMDPAGNTHAQITLDWPDVTTNADGSAITDLALYEVWQRPTGGTFQHLTDVTGSTAALSPYDPGSVWEYQVRARDTSGNWGDFSPTVAVTAAADAMPPPIPSTPTVNAVPKVLQVSWDGKTSTGAAMADAAPDFYAVEVHASTVSGFVPSPGDPATMVGILQGAGTLMKAAAIGEEWYACLLAVDTSRNYSAPSGQASQIIPPNSDGAVPPAPAKPGLAPLGVMALQASWAAVTNADPVTYDVYVGTTDTPASDAGNLVASTASTFASIDKLADGTELDAETDYFTQVIARDADGSSAASPVSDAAQVRQADASSISVDYVYTREVQADQVVGGNFQGAYALLGALTVGNNISITPDGGIVINLANGGTISFPADGSDAYIQAMAHLLSATIDDNFTLNGIHNHLTGTLNLDAGVLAPGTAPSLAWTTSPDADGLQTVQATGFTGHPTGWVRWLTSGTATTFTVYDSAGVSYTFPTLTSGGVIRCAALIGTGSTAKLYVLTTGYGTGNVRAAPVFYSATNGDSSWTTVNNAAGSASGDVFYSDGAQLLSMAISPQSSGSSTYGLSLNYWSLTSGNTTTGVWSALPSSVTDRTVKGFWYGAGDYGANRMIVATISDAGNVTNRVFTPTISSGLITGWGAELTANSFSSIRSTSDAVISYTNGHFYVWDGASTIAKCSALTAALARSITYTWYDSDATGGTHETTPSPAATITQLPRRFVKVTVPAPADQGGSDDPDSVRVYIGNHLVSTLSGTVAYIIDNPALTGAAAPTVNGFNSTGKVGKFQTAGAAPFVLNGDGTGDWPVITNRITALEKNGALYTAVSTSTQALPNGASTIVTGWSGSGNLPWSSAYANGVWTVGIAGTYVVNCSISWTAPGSNNTTGARGIFIFVNGSEVRRFTSAVTDHSVLQVSTVVHLNVGDTVDFRAYQNSGTDGISLVASPGHEMQTIRIGS